MKQTTTKTFCDICKKEASITIVKYPVVFTTDQTEGRPCKPYISYLCIDMCEECEDAALMITAVGAQGVNSFSIKKKVG